MTCHESSFSLCLQKCFQLISLPCEFSVLCTINTINFHCWLVPAVILISSVFIVAGLCTCTAQTSSLLCASWFVPWERLSAINVRRQFIIRLWGDKTGCWRVPAHAESIREDEDPYHCSAHFLFPVSNIHGREAPSSPVLEQKTQRTPSCRSWFEKTSVLHQPASSTGVITTAVWSVIHPSPPAAFIEPDRRRSWEVSSNCNWK